MPFNIMAGFVTIIFTAAAIARVEGLAPGAASREEILLES
jgi:hypothetical protein